MGHKPVFARSGRILPYFVDKVALALLKPRLEAEVEVVVEPDVGNKAEAESQLAFGFNTVDSIVGGKHRS